MRNYYNITDVPYERQSLERVLTGFNDLDYNIKGLEVGITLVVANTNCVDCDTEYFNGFGWKKISDYQKGDMVLQYNQNKTAELVYPLIYHKTECETLNLFQNGRKSINQCVSNNHNIVYINKSTKCIDKVPFSIIKKDIKSIKYKAEIIGGFDFENYNGFSIEENELRLYIAISADGHFKKTNKNNYCRINLKHEYKKQRLEYLLEKCGIKYHKRKTNPKDICFDTYTFISPKKIKQFPVEWYGLNKECYKIIYDEVFHWDGQLEEKHKCYRTTIKSNADFIQFVCSSLGKRTSIKCDDRIGERMSNKKYIRKSICYTVRPSYNDCNISMCGNAYATITDYKSKDGYMYCFTVPSGMLVLRRENTINITGNCGKSTLVQGFIAKSIEQGYKNWIFSGEHTERSFLQLLYHQNSQKKDYVPIQYKDTNIVDWYITEEKEKEIKEKFDNNIFIYSNSNKRDINSMINSMTECYEKENARFFLIDNLISIDNISSNVFAEQTVITEKLRTFALTKKVIIVLVAHQRKIAEKGFRIDIQDVAGSQNISNKAYNVIAQYRIDMLNKDNKDYKRLAQDLAKDGFDIEKCDNVLEILKTKGNKTGLVGLVYDAETKTYRQAEKMCKTDADKIFKKYEKQVNVFDDLIPVDTESGDLPF